MPRSKGKSRGTVDRSFRDVRKESCELTSSKILPTFAVTNNTGTPLPAILQCVKKGKFALEERKTTDIGWRSNDHEEEEEEDDVNDVEQRRRDRCERLSGDGSTTTTTTHEYRVLLHCLERMLQDSRSTSTRLGQPDSPLTREHLDRVVTPGWKVTPGEERSACPEESTPVPRSGHGFTPSTGRIKPRTANTHY